MSANPYVPPMANVADMQPAHGEFQEPSVTSARGRIGRLRLLVYTNTAALLMYLVVLVLTLVVAGGAAFSAGANNPMGMLAALGGSLFLVMGVFFILGVAFFVYFYMKLVQRSHDMGWSGWTTLLTLVPLVVLVWFFMPGNKQANAYGPPPTPNSLIVKIAAGIYIGLTVVSIASSILLAVAASGQV